MSQEPPEPWWRIALSFGLMALAAVLFLATVAMCTGLVH